MKTIYCFIAALLIACTPAFAESFTPQFKKGNTATYKSVNTQVFEVMPGSETLSTMTVLNTATVTNINETGPVVSLTTDDMSNEVTGFMASAMNSLLPEDMVDCMKGMVVQYQYDRQGKVVDVLNFDAVSAKAKEYIDNCPALLRPMAEPVMKMYYEKEMLVKQFNSFGTLFGLSGINVEKNGKFTTNIPGMGAMAVTCTGIEKKTEGTQVSFESGVMTDFPELYENTMKATMERMGVTELSPEKKVQIEMQIKEIFADMKITCNITYDLYKNCWPAKTRETTTIDGSNTKLKRTTVERTCISSSFN